MFLKDSSEESGQLNGKFLALLFSFCTIIYVSTASSIEVISTSVPISSTTVIDPIYFIDYPNNFSNNNYINFYFVSGIPILCI
jgi:hypothetical protein